MPLFSIPEAKTEPLRDPPPAKRINLGPVEPYPATPHVLGGPSVYDTPAPPDAHIIEPGQRFAGRSQVKP